HGARDVTNVWDCGRIAGSPSSDPRRIAISSPAGHSPPTRLEPQTEQKAFTRPSSGRNVRISSSPTRRRDLSPGRGPVFRQRHPSVCGSGSSDSDWPTEKGAVTSKRTPPNRHEPPSGCAGLGSLGIADKRYEPRVPAFLRSNLSLSSASCAIDQETLATLLEH